MLSGETVTVDPTQRTVEGATIVTADTPATNGIVHTLNRALFVPTPTPPPVTTAPAG
jgi:hypothetical protein